ncbi:MAG: ribulose-phosphate 3-epimerase [Bacteroidota bacterium]
MIRIAPSILAADFTRLREQIAQAEAGGADWFHLDVMDGRFVPNLTFGPMVVSALRKLTKLPLDVHLMIVEPENHLEQFRHAGADHIIIHQEACIHLHRTIARIKELGAKAGVAINPATPCSTLTEILPDLDIILMMSVNPGFGGQRFIPGTLRKVAEARSMASSLGLDIRIEVDGGIDTTTAPKVVKAGADVLIAGTSVFGNDNVEQAVRRLQESVA